jgi:hypothetical protein
MLQRRHARAARRSAVAGPAGGGASDDASRSEEDAGEQRRIERKQARERTRAATSYNRELGVAVVKRLSRLKVDERIVKVLAAVNLSGELGRIAMRGARYGFPGWPREVELRNGRTRLEYLSATEAEEKAREYVAVAKSAADVAGRLFALVAMARYADEEAVARSQRAFHEVGGHGRALPWSVEVVDLIDELCAERLPEHLVGEPIAERRRWREQEQRRRERDAEAERLVAEAIERLPELDAAKRAELAAEVEERLGERSFMAWRLRQRVDELNAAARHLGDAEGEPEAA